MLGLFQYFRQSCLSFQELLHIWQLSCGNQNDMGSGSLSLILGSWNTNIKLEIPFNYSKTICKENRKTFELYGVTSRMMCFCCHCNTYFRVHSIYLRRLMFCHFTDPSMDLVVSLSSCP